MIVWIAIRQKDISVAVRFEIHLTITPSSAWMNDDVTTRPMTKNWPEISLFAIAMYWDFIAETNNWNISMKFWVENLWIEIL